MHKFGRACIFLLSICTLQCEHVYTQEKSEALDWLPKDAVEIKLQEPLLLAETNEPERLELGDLRMGKAHYLTVNYTNMCSGVVCITDMKATCGCIGGIKQQVKVAPGEKSQFVVIIKPKTTAKEFAQKVTVRFEGANDWQFLLRGKVVSDYVAVPDRVEQLSKNQEFHLVISRSVAQAADLTDIEVVSLSGFTKVTQLKTDQNSIEFLMTTLEKDRNAGVEMLALKDKEGKVIAEVPVAIVAVHDLYCLPTTIALRRKKAQFEGSGTLLGREEVLNSLPERLTVVLEDYPEVVGSVDLSERSKKSIRINVHFPLAASAKISGQGGVVAGKLRGDDHKEIGDPVRFVFFDSLGEWI